MATVRPGAVLRAIALVRMGRVHPAVALGTRPRRVGRLRDVAQLPLHEGADHPRPLPPQRIHEQASRGLRRDERPPGRRRRTPRLALLVGGQHGHKSSIPSQHGANHPRQCPSGPLRPFPAPRRTVAGEGNPRDGRIADQAGPGLARTTPRERASRGGCELHAGTIPPESQQRATGRGLFGQERPPAPLASAGGLMSAWRPCPVYWPST